MLTQRAMTNISPQLHTVKDDAGGTAIRAVCGVTQGPAERCHRHHPPTAGAQHVVITQGGAGVEDVQFAGVLGQAGDGVALAR